MTFSDIRADVAARCVELEVKGLLSYEEVFEVQGLEDKLKNDQSEEARELWRRLRILARSQSDRLQTKLRKRYADLLQRVVKNEKLSTEEEKEFKEVAETLSSDH